MRVRGVVVLMSTFKFFVLQLCISMCTNTVRKKITNATLLSSFCACLCVCVRGLLYL